MPNGNHHAPSHRSPSFASVLRFAACGIAKKFDFPCLAERLARRVETDGVRAVMGVTVASELTWLIPQSHARRERCVWKKLGRRAYLESSEALTVREVTEIAANLADAIRDVEQALEHRFARPMLLVVPNLHYWGHPDANAMATSTIRYNRIVIRKDVLCSEDGLRVLKHELGHILVYEVCGSQVPYWLNEGVAKFAEFAPSVALINAPARLTSSDIDAMAGWLSKDWLPKTSPERPNPEDYRTIIEGGKSLVFRVSELVGFSGLKEALRDVARENGSEGVVIRLLNWAKGGCQSQTVSLEKPGESDERA